MNLLVTGGVGFIGSNLIHHVINRPDGREVNNKGTKKQRKP